jgi:hypothetical protein
MTTLLLDFSYQAISEDGDEIGLLDNLYPYDLVPIPDRNGIDGGNFDLGTSDNGLDADGGNLDTGELSLAYLFDGGNFDTGVGSSIPLPPNPADYINENGSINPETDNVIKLIDEEFNEILVSTLPSIYTPLKDFIGVDFTLELSLPYGIDIACQKRFFEGFDYGSTFPDFGYSVDYGLINDPTEVSFDFNSITEYVEPIPSSSVVA